MVREFTEQKEKDDELLQQMEYRIECMEPEIESYEQVSIKYELDME